MEDYLEENHVFEIFEDMMKALIINKPDDPIKFLLDHVTNPPSKLKMRILNKPTAATVVEIFKKFVSNFKMLSQTLHHRWPTRFKKKRNRVTTVRILE